MLSPSPSFVINEALAQKNQPSHMLVVLARVANFIHTLVGLDLSQEGPWVSQREKTREQQSPDGLYG